MKRRVIFYFLLVFLFTIFNFYYRPIQKNPLITEPYRKSSSYVNSLYRSDEYFKKNLLDKEDYAVYEQLIQDVKDGKDQGLISCSDNCSKAFLNSYYVLYLDHPEFFAFQSASGRISNHSIQTRYYHLSKWKAYFGTRRIEREIDIVKKETKNMSDKKKILYVYDYVASHTYDRLFTYSNSNQSAYSFFTKGSSVCAGFAKASQIIFQNIGISSYLVMNNDHMWNYVKYDGKYYVFDATVGASYQDKGNAHFYDGLGQTTVGATTGLFRELYPEIEEKTLKEIFEQ